MARMTSLVGAICDLWVGVHSSVLRWERGLIVGRRSRTDWRLRAICLFGLQGDLFGYLLLWNLISFECTLLQSTTETTKKCEETNFYIASFAMLFFPCEKICYKRNVVELSCSQKKMLPCRENLQGYCSKLSGCKCVVVSKGQPHCKRNNFCSAGRLKTPAILRLEWRFRLMKVLNITGSINKLRLSALV